MSATAIEWTDATWNPVIGCSPVSPGCLNCYAATMARRLERMRKPDYEARAPHHHYDQTAQAHRIAEVRNGRAVFTGDVRLLEHRLTEPMRWRKPRRVFVCSMSDLFHPAVPFDFIDQVWAVMALCPQHTFQVLTKRPERMAEYLAPRVSWGDVPWPLPNVWGGTSAENQSEFDRRIVHLLHCRLAVRFLSLEPLLGPIPRLQLAGIDWVIVGGESGPHARPCNVEWIRSIVRQCRDADTRCFVKQLGATPRINYYEWLRWCEERQWDEMDAPIVTPNGHRWSCAMDGQPRIDALACIPTRRDDRKGADPAEWPEDIRVREYPEVHA